MHAMVSCEREAVLRGRRLLEGASGGSSWCEVKNEAGVKVEDELEII